MKAFFRFLRILAKDCGMLRLGGRELSIINVTNDGFVVRDVFGHSKPFSVKRNDSKINEIQLPPEFE